MRFTVVSCVYPPEPVVSARMSREISEAARNRGDEVTVIAPFPSRPAGVIYDGFEKRWRRCDRHEGLTTIRCFSLFSRKSTLLSRFAENLSFGISSAFTLLTLRRQDVVFVNSWPLFANTFALLAARLRGARVVLSVQDVYPESLAIQKRAGARPAFRLLRAIDGAAVRRAAALLVLTAQWKTLYAETRGVAPERIHVVPNWIDADAGAISDDQTLAWRRSRGIEDDERLVVFGGSISAAAGVESLIEAWARVAPTRARLLIAGDGAHAERCEQLAAATSSRIEFLRPWPRELTGVVLGAADLLVLPAAAGQTQVSVPSKLLSYLLAARPVLALVERDSEAARIVEDARCGWTAAPGNDEEFGNALRAAIASPREQLDQAGAGGRAYALEHFESTKAIARVLAIVDEVAR